MSADVVAPVGKADVGSSRREPRLKCQRVPHRNRIARKPNLVAVVAQPAPAMEEQRPLVLALLITEMHQVDPPGRPPPCRFGIVLLLPVEPPEVDTLLF